METDYEKLVICNRLTLMNHTLGSIELELTINYCVHITTDSYAT